MIFYIGDIHGDFRALEEAIELSKRGDTIIQVGDFGVGSLHERKLEALGETAQEVGVRILAIRGNHDEPTLFHRRRQFGGLHLMSDHSAMEIEGKLHYFFGGASSIDRSVKIENRNWWRGEVPLNVDDRYFKDNRAFIYNGEGPYGVVDKKIDVVITHTCPTNVFPVELPNENNQLLAYYLKFDKKLIEYLKTENKKMDSLQEVILSRFKPSEWYYGHFHVSCINVIGETKYRCLAINEIL